MAIGGFKAAKLRATTNKSTQTGVIISYAANAKDTLTNVKDIIVGFGNWTWNNDLGFLSTTGDETDQYISYHTTLTHTNGAKLFISYGAAGVQYHWSCFAQYRAGSRTAYPTLTESGTTYTLSADQAGGWFSGLCMSMIPAGSANSYGTPNRTDNTWMPSDATPILGYLGTNNASYKEATTVSTAARMTSGNEYIYIMAKDDLFIVMCHDPTWGGFSSADGMGAPCYLGYAVGNMFENLNPDDNAYYAPYGWWGGQVAARITNGSPYLRGWSAAFSASASRVQPYYLGNNQTFSGAIDTGTLGFFRKDGTRFAEEGPDGFLYAEVLCEEQSALAPLLYQTPQNARWYALEVGILAVSEASAQTIPSVAQGTLLKGTVRTDFMRAYVIVDPRYDTRFRVPPYGTKFENGNFIMGPCNIAIGWDASFTDAETEELCPWRGQSGFEYNNSVDFGGYNDTICSIASTGSKLYIFGIDAGTGNVYYETASTGSTSLSAATTITLATTGGLLQKASYTSGDSVIYHAIAVTDGSSGHFLISSLVPSTSVYTQIRDFSIYSNIFTGNPDWIKELPFCVNKYAKIFAAWTSRNASYYDIRVNLWLCDTNGNTYTSNILYNTTYIVQDACTDIYGNFYAICMDQGSWSTSGVPSGATNGTVLIKYEYNAGTYTRITGEDQPTDVWKALSCGLGQAMCADKYGYMYIFYTSTGEADVTQIGTVDMGVKKLKPDGTICWTKHLGISGGTLGHLRVTYTYDNKIHFAGQTDTAFPEFSMTNTIDTFFGTMTTDGVFSVKYQGGFINNATIDAMCSEGAYDYLGINTTTNNTKPKYALMKRTW